MPCQPSQEESLIIMSGTKVKGLSSLAVFLHAALGLPRVEPVVQAAVPAENKTERCSPFTDHAG